jgi:hypothetical protein
MGKIAGRHGMARRQLAAVTVLVFAAVIASPAAALAASPAPAPVASSAAPSATTYQAVNVSLVVSAGSVPAGGHVTVAGRGFGAGEPIDLTVAYGSKPKADGSAKSDAQNAAYLIAPAGFVSQSLAAEVAADSTGAFTHTLVLSQAGMAAITATGTISLRTSSSTVDVLPRSVVAVSASPHSAFFSSSQLMLLAAVPVFLLLGGLLFAGRRKMLVHRGLDPIVLSSQPVAHEPFTVS